MSETEKISMELFSDVGMGELFMSRLFNFETDILQGLVGIDHKEIEHLIFRTIFDGLEPAFRSLRSLREKWNDPEIPKKEKIQLIENIFSYLVVAFKDRFQEVAYKMGYDISFLFKNQKIFEKEYVEFQKKHPMIDPKFILEDREWLNILIGVRNNVIDHKAGKDPDIIKQLSVFLTLENVEILFDNCWRSVEDFLAAFAVDKTDSKYGMKIQELVEYRKNKTHDHRFGWFDASLKL